MSQKPDSRSPIQRASQLVNSSIFQRRIYELRNKWNIHKNGFQTDDEIGKWYDWLYKTSDEYLNKGNPVKNQPILEFGRDIDKLRLNIKKSGYWRDVISHYLLRNMLPPLASNAVVSLDRDKTTKEWSISIRIWEHTRLKDINRVWKITRHLQNKIVGFKKSFRDPDPRIFERNQFILQQKKLNRKAKEIAIDVNNKFNVKTGKYDDIYNMDASTVRKILSEEKKRELK